MPELHGQRIAAAFRQCFGEPGLLIKSPARVNLIGEHTDYNMGFVLPAAVDKAIWFAIRRRDDAQCSFYSVDLDERFSMDIGSLAKSDTHWANYLLGVLSEMAKDGHCLKGVDCAFGGNVPIGSGMSSSAALECGFAMGLNELFQLNYDRVNLAKLGQRSENRFVGVNCGIMDQFASVLGREGQLIRLDCRDLSYQYVPFKRDDLRIVLCDTQVRRTLAGSEYNIRRAQCEAGVAILAKHFPEVRSLRDATMAMIEPHRAEFDAVAYRRCTYVIRENQRVLDACAALIQEDFHAFGALMNESHAGLSQDYEVSCTELDALAEGAQSIPGVLGSRMMGAGFGGCTINLVEEAALPAFQEGMAAVFRERLRLEPLMHVCRLTGGTEVVKPSPSGAVHV